MVRKGGGRKRRGAPFPTSFHQRVDLLCRLVHQLDLSLPLGRLLPTSTTATRVLRGLLLWYHGELVRRESGDSFIMPITIQHNRFSTASGLDLNEPVLIESFEEFIGLFIARLFDR